MLRNYLVTALRSIRKSPLYSLINISSLAIGLAACFVIYLFINDERSFDAFHSKNSSIYRIDEVQRFSGTNDQKVALSMPGMGPHIKQDFPEVISYTRFWNRQKRLLENGERQFLIENVAFVDSTFLDIFDFELIAGDRETVLGEPNSLVATESTIKKFFFDHAREVLGKSLKFQGKEYKITGVLKDVPENSHLQFNALISMSTMTSVDPGFNDQSGSNFLNTYLVVNSETDISAMEKRFPEFMIRYTGNEEVNDYYTLFLQPLAEVHLASTDIEHDYNNYRKFNGEYLGIFSIVGLFILLIAAVNFMNLTTSRASHRWKEIGVRKSAGAKKTQLFSQFIFESVILALVALIFAVLLDILSVPLLNQLIGRHLNVMLLLQEPLKILVVIMIAIGLGLLTGIYPAFYMTSRKLTTALKGNKTDGGSIFRSTLVVVQFGLALAMIVSTLVVIQQLNYMKNKDIGFDKSQMLLVNMNKEANEKFETLKNELLRSSYISGVTASGQRIGNNFHQWGFKVKADTGIVDLTPSNVNVDYDYLTVYGIKLKDGRNFSKDITNDKGLAYIINETLAKELGLTDPVGTPAGHSWYDTDSLGTIIGVVEDFNFNSLHHKINTLEMVVHPDWGYDEMSIKLRAGNVEAAVAEVKKLWEQQVSSYPFTYSFLDDHFDNLYRSDKQMSAVVSIMAGLAILISCMGLFGLAAIMTERKIKEIGIRKVLGATASQITILLSKNFALLIMISFVLVSPVTYLLLSSWLNEFAYRITVNPLLFVAGAGIALAISLATISYHTIRLARANPVKALRFE